MKSEYAEIARGTLLLSSAPEPIVDDLLARATVTAVDRGATIFSQDAPADTIFIVLEGWVKLYRMSASGSEAVVGVFTSGHSIGETVTPQGGTYPVFAEAVTEARLLRIDAKSFRAHLESSPAVAISMLTATYALLHSLVAQIEQLKGQTGPQRVAEFLLDLTPVDTGPCSVTLPYDKVLIAGRLGLKPESLSRAFAKLREQGGDREPVLRRDRRCGSAARIRPARPGVGLAGRVGGPGRRAVRDARRGRRAPGRQRAEGAVRSFVGNQPTAPGSGARSRAGCGGAAVLPRAAGPRPQSPECRKCPARGRRAGADGDPVVR